MKKYYDIEGSTTLMRDVASHAVINKSDASLRVAREQKRIRLNDKERLNNVENRLNNIEDMLSKILEKLN